MERITLLVDNGQILQGMTSVGFVGLVSSTVILTKTASRHLCRQKQAIVLGLLFGLAAVVAVITAGQTADGIVLISRAAIIAVAALTGGPVSGGIAAFFALAARFAIDPTMPGLVISTAAVPFAIGLAAHQLLVRTRRSSATWSVVVTAAGAAVLTPLASFLADDVGRGWPLLLERGPVLSAVIFASTLILGLLITLDQVLHRPPGSLPPSGGEPTKASRPDGAPGELTSHELRTPLAAIVGYATLLDETATDTRLRERLSIISTAGRDLLTLFNRINGPMTALGPRPRDTLAPRAFLGHMEQLYTPLALDRGLQLRTGMGAGVPGTLIMDPAGLRQAVSNLLGKVIAGSPFDCVMVELSWETAGGTGEGWLVVVVQEGAPDVALSPAAPRAAWLELAVSRQLAADLGGELSAMHMGGGGSRYVLRIPAERSTSPAGGATPDGTRLDGLRILAVDDVALLAQLTRIQLQAAGADAEAFSDPHQAVQAFAVRTYDAAVVDLQMPGMSGMELAAHVRALPNGAQTVLLALTADVDERTAREAIHAGFDDLLHKPATPEALCRRLSVLVGGRA
mgnify:CR=1 FL=1